MKTETEALKFAAAVARHRSWQLNTDREFVSVLCDGLAVNFNRFGYFQCPCRDSWGMRERDSDIICPCQYAAQDIEEYGQCFCGLYVSDEFAAANCEAVPIPERRPDAI